MSIKEKLDFIDDFLCDQENYLHGEEGDECTISRKYVNEIRKEIKYINNYINNVLEG